MPTQREVGCTLLAFQLQQARTLEQLADVQARCDASGIPMEEVRAHPRIEVIRSRLDAQPPPRNQIVSGESLVKHGNTLLACGTCTEEKCDCRRLDSSGGAFESPRAARAVNTDFADDGPFFTFTSDDANYAKALRWLGPERSNELRAEGEQELEQKRKATPGASSAGTYNGLVATTIAAAHPDLADRARHETTTWLRSQFAALPLPSSNDERRTDMTRDAADEARDKMNERRRNAWREPLGPYSTQQPHDRTDAAGAARNSHTAYARPSAGGETNLTEAEQTARADAAESRYEEQQLRNVYLEASSFFIRREARFDLAASDDDTTDLEKDKGKRAKRSGGASARLKALLDSSGGKFTHAQADQARKLIAQVTSEDGENPDDEDEDDDRTDARDNRRDSSEAEVNKARQAARQRSAQAWRQPL